MLQVNRALIKAEDDNGWTGLEHAIARGRAECCIWLVRKGKKKNFFLKFFFF
jgi:ankyrin repeat protein